MIAVIALAAAALGGAPSNFSLSVAPAHLELEAGSTAAIHVQGAAGRRLVLRASVAGLALDGQGRPRLVVARDAAGWLVIHPRARSTAGGATFLINARCPSHARPGDHTAIVLVTAATPNRKRINVVMRVGLVVTVRVPGAATHRIDAIAARLRPLRGKRGVLVAVTFANRGDLIEWIGGSRLQVSLWRGRHVVARFHLARRALLPHTRTVVGFAWRTDVPGPALARIALARPGGGTSTSTFRLKL